MYDFQKISLQLKMNDLYYVKWEFCIFRIFRKIEVQIFLSNIF